MVYLICENKNNAKYANTNQGNVSFKYTDDNSITNLIKLQHGNMGKTYTQEEQKEKILKHQVSYMIRCWSEDENNYVIKFNHDSDLKN